MIKTHVLVAVVLSALTACGGDENEGGGDDAPVEVDQRSHMTGTYPVTGTLTMVVDGKSDVSQVQDTLRITNDKTSTSKAALRLDINSLGCGPRASMNGPRNFSVSKTQCPMPSENGCTYSMTYTGGHGSKEADGTLQTSLQGQITIDCGSRGLTVDVVMVMSGSRTGQSLPGSREDALTGTAPLTLRDAVERLTRSAQH
jgi:hypothetical protein